MKWIVHGSPGTSEAPQLDQGAVVVELPESLRLTRPKIGEAFEAVVTRTLSDGTKNSQPIVCRLVGDGKSLLVGHRVVRITRPPWPLKKGRHRMRAGSDGIVRDREFFMDRLRPVQPKKAAQTSVCGDVIAPLTGKVIKVALSEGDSVREGDLLAVIEAMKMENQIRSESDGFVLKNQVREGDAVKVGDVLLTLCPQPPEARSSDK